jgi:hypothetical protein
MRKGRWVSWLGVAAAAVAFGGVGTVQADVVSDRAAAIVNYPIVEVEVQGGVTIMDTLFQLSNTSDEPVLAHCFYENANSHCTNTGIVCQSSAQCTGDGLGICVPGWNENDFYVRLTPRQPLGWLASEGLTEFPIDGINRTGVGGSSNVGSRIPQVPELPFLGMLKCIAIDDNGNPVDRNVLKGEATVLTLVTPNIDAVKYNAVGIQAIAGAVNNDRTLVLGGDEAEYNGCPSVLILNHFFDGVKSPVNVAGVGPTTPYPIRTALALMPCSQDLLRQIPGRSTVQYLVYNEFEQRFSTSRTVDCLQFLPLSLIDTTQPERSIFNAGVSGTVAGQTRLTPLHDGLIGVAWELHNPTGLAGIGPATSTAAFNIHYQGSRAAADEIILP